MPRPKGLPRTGGRKKGTPNKTTAAVREAFVEAFAMVNQGPTALGQWGRENPDKFYPLAVRLIPQEITGAGGEPLVVQFTNEVARRTAS